MADWKADLSGVAGSGLVHLVAAVACLASLEITCPRPGIDPYSPFDVAVSRSSALFELTPALPTSARMDAMPTPAECAVAIRALAPMLVSSGAFRPAIPYERPPRLCARVGVDGHVLAARVLRSSGRRASDRTLEAEARLLLFTPAQRDGRAVATTVTLDVIGGAPLDRPPGVPIETPVFGPF